jgi:hypothetical protein
MPRDIRAAGLLRQQLHSLLVNTGLRRVKICMLPIPGTRRIYACIARNSKR